MDPSMWEGMASVLSSKLPYFNPFMMVNTSETCAARRLLQCRQLGIWENDVSRKFQHEYSSEAITDLSREEWHARKAVIDAVARWTSKQNQKQGDCEWTPILYKYEIVKTSAKRERDWGHVLFSDMTNTRFLLVMLFPKPCNCGNLSHHDYDALTKYHANKLMCLLKCLFVKENPPKWVRATYSTANERYALQPGFLSPGYTSMGPRIHTAMADTFVPALLDSELEKIGNVIAQLGKSANPIPDDVRAAVLGTKGDRPELGPAFTAKQVSQCAGCQRFPESEKKAISQCSRCKLVRYCSTECQRSHWKYHKIFCKTMVDDDAKVEDAKAD